MPNRYLTTGFVSRVLLPLHLSSGRSGSGAEGFLKFACSSCMGQRGLRWKRSEMAESRRASANDYFFTPPPSTSDRWHFQRATGDGKRWGVVHTRFNDQGVLEPILSEEQKVLCEAALKILLEKTGEVAGKRRLYSEFQALQSDIQTLGKSYSVAQYSVNDVKNRYSDVLPFDDTRVTLKSQGGLLNASPGYINASHIEDDTIEGAPRHIATQAPLQSTVDDFWEMVFQQRSPAIVMLSRPEDDRREVQALYFPPNVGESRVFGRIAVINRSVEQCRNPIALRTYEVQDITNKEAPLSVVHFEYLAWPDHGVPRSTTPVRELVRNLYQLPKDGGPLVVHCSAGIGRTGTFITINNTMHRILSGDLSATDVQNTVSHFRNYRSGLVQTSEQYRFIYQAVIDELQDLVSKDYSNPRNEGTVAAPYHVPWS